MKSCNIRYFVTKYEVYFDDAGNLIALIKGTKRYHAVTPVDGDLDEAVLGLSMRIVGYYNDIYIQDGDVLPEEHMQQAYDLADSVASKLGLV